MPKVADFIEKHREQLVERFVQRAGNLDSARSLKPYELVDTLPEYLSTLATISRQGHRGDPAATKKRLEGTHIGLRLRHGYSQEEVTAEYALIGRLLASLWEGLPREEQPPPEDTGLLFEELQDAMNQVVATYSGYTLEDRQAEKRTQRQLDALAPKALERRGQPSASQLAPLLEIIQEALHVDGAELLLVDGQGQGLECAAVTGAFPSLPPGQPMPLHGRSFVARVASSDEPLHLPDAATSPPGTVRDEVRHSGLRSLLALRLWPHGKLLGVLTVGVKETRVFEPRVQRYFETLGESLSRILDRALLVGELRHSEVRFRRISEAGIVGIVEWDASGRITAANDTLLHMLGYTREDVKTGRLNFRTLTPPEHQEATERTVRTLKETGVIQPFEKQYLHRDGHRVDILIGSATLDEARERGIALVLDISERKRVEEEYRTLAESMPQVVWTSRPDGALDYINQVFADYIGKSTEKALGRSWMEFVHPEDLPLTAERWTQVVSTGGRYEVEHRVRRADGVYRWFLTRAQPMTEAGHVVKWFGTSTDIEDKKREQGRLELLARASTLGTSLDYERTLAQVAQFAVPALADWCFVDIIGEDGKARRVEVAFRDPSKAALAEQTRRFPPGNNPEQPSAQGLRAGKTVLIQEYTEELLRQQAQNEEHLRLFLHIGVRSVIVVPLVAHGRQLAVVTFATTKESERRYGPEDLMLVEEVARRAAQAVENARLHRGLQQSEELLKTVFETLPVGVWVTDAQGLLTMNNAAVRRIWEGARRVSMKDYGEFEAWWLETGERVTPEQWALSRALSKGETILNEVLRIRTFTGKERIILNSAAPLYDAEGRISGGIAVNEDITERMRVQEEVRQRAEFERQLIGIVSHDLRNPLGAIKLGATALLQRDDLNERQTKNVVRIQSAAERAIRLIRDLLDFTQARLGGGIPVSPKPMELHGFTRQVVDEVQLVHPERRLDVESQGDGRGEWDPDRLAQVLTNLLTNALNYSPADTPVTVRSRGEDGTVLLEVHNAGAPIPSEQLPRMFEPLERGTGQQDRVGSSIGLGLFIVRHIVEAHGGTISVRSEAKEGTTFTVHLPRKCQTPPPPGEGTTPSWR
ncbi:MAG TPA: PAS domain S-box protein [Archangium sp.]|jgi:PAS domain S-box-containing protein|uniref:PAS domain S-box protein n=1 Tax=Archangium sp. TaxID=1872627 RepID=UPI002ED97836